MALSSQRSAAAYSGSDDSEPLQCQQMSLKISAWGSPRTSVRSGASLAAWRHKSRPYSLRPGNPSSAFFTRAV